jgi:hypothetical protein
VTRGPEHGQVCAVTLSHDGGVVRFARDLLNLDGPGEVGVACRAVSTQYFVTRTGVI